MVAFVDLQLFTFKWSKSVPFSKSSPADKSNLVLITDLSLKITAFVSIHSYYAPCSLFLYITDESSAEGVPLFR